MRWSKPSKRADRSVSARLGRELLHERLVELSSLWRERHDPVLRGPAVHGIEGGSHDIDTQDHSRPAPVRVVVDLARGQRRRVAVVEDSKLELGAEDGGQWTSLPYPGEGAGYQREDVQAHDAEP